MNGKANEHRQGDWVIWSDTHGPKHLTPLPWSHWPISHRHCLPAPCDIREPLLAVPPGSTNSSLSGEPCYPLAPALPASDCSFLPAPCTSKTPLNTLCSIMGQWNQFPHVLGIPEFQAQLTFLESQSETTLKGRKVRREVWDN